MTPNEILVEIRNRKFRPVYLLSGEEPYYIDLVSDYIIENVLTGEEKAFNQSIFYGKDTDVADLVNTALRFPMMASHQLIVLREAHLMKDLDKLANYAEKPLKSTILVINYKYGSYDKRKKLSKVIESSGGALMESPRLYENKVPAWINTWLKKRKCSITPDASMLLVEYLGTDLGKIANELEKLIITLPETNRSITTGTIERNIGISKDYNNFELQKALAQKNALKANRIINYFAQNQKANPFTLTIFSLFTFFSKVFTLHFIKDRSPRNLGSVLRVNPYFLSEYEMAAKKYDARKTARIISWLREYDMRSKGFDNLSATEGDLLKEMIFKILH
ncbi:MAG: DNA polymerase III subunit delta [Marinilabiliales bacterium]|nr:MAG: DNA polymerase III subunit delta [Marinilabiliales bacterium]